MKILTIKECGNFSAINIDRIEAVIKSEDGTEIKVVCGKWNYTETFTNRLEQEKRFTDILQYLEVEK